MNLQLMQDCLRTYREQLVVSGKVVYRNKGYYCLFWQLFQCSAEF